MVLYQIVEFFIQTLTTLAMLPALTVLKDNGRHFELFIGTFQFAISFLYSFAHVLGEDFFLLEIEWHLISDVLSLSYMLLLLIHLMGIPDENTNHILRYLAFAFSWIMKVRDGWDSISYEFLLVLCFVGAVIYRNVVESPSKAPINWEYAKRLGGCLILLLFIYLFMEYFIDYDPLQISVGVFHIHAGITGYYAWLVIPVRDIKKNDDIKLPGY